MLEKTVDGEMCTSILFDHEKSAVAMSNLFDITFTIKAWTDNLRVLLLIACDYTTWTISVATHSLILEQSLDDEIQYLLTRVQLEPLRLGIFFHQFSKFFRLL